MNFRTLCSLVYTVSLSALTVIAITSAMPAWGNTTGDEERGLAELDEATRLKFSAQSLSDLENVADRCESALKKGLGEKNQQFARQLLTSTLLEAASEVTGRILDAPALDPRWPVLRRIALRYLERAIGHDDQLANAHYQLARLQVLPGGDLKKARRAIDQAVQLADSKDEAEKQDRTELLSDCLVLRAQLVESAPQRLDDLNRAIALRPQNVKARQLRAVLALAKGDSEKAIEDFEMILKADGGNLDALLGASQALARLDKLDEALARINKVVELKPDAARVRILRAQLLAAAKKYEGAIADLDQALEVSPQDIDALLLRARVRLALDQQDLARSDVDRALDLSPSHPSALMLRSLLHAGEGAFDRAIADLERLLRLDPDNHQWRMQLARYYQANKKPRKAIDIFNGILLLSEKNEQALRGRADALLSIGKQSEAIEDYNAVLKANPDDSHVLNNLAWVLATSPRADLRDAERAIELATKACQLTEYKKPHILSTLGAAYAEQGDFETAKKWSAKAVELASDDNKEQLAKELKSYQQGNPWRELQDIENNPAPPSPNDFQR